MTAQRDVADHEAAPGKRPEPLADPGGADEDQDGGDDPASAHRHLLGGILATMDEMTPGHRRAGRMSVTPKAAADDRGRRARRTEDEKFLERARAPDFLQTDPWRALRILSEFVEGFDAMAKVGPAVTVFGSARTEAEDPVYELARGDRLGGWPRPATP